MSDNATRELLPVQRAIVSAWPSAWIDAFAMCSDDGGITLVALDGETIALDARVTAAAGEPVAFHRVAEVLSVGGELIRARRR
ncbi:hypothetical protein [Microbacterium marinilacus]|nr:hypothetical protein [Microbacterium marinilacus]MBY0687163.1 hypothetical protein [Microbacterium marinilacus]